MQVTDYSEERLLVAEGCRILALRGLVDDILGHISLRVGEDSLLVRCRGREERGLKFTQPDDIHLVRLDGSTELPDGYSAPNELPLHLASLRARPDVSAVVHAHPPAVVALTLIGVPLLGVVGAYNIPAMRMALAGIPTFARSVLIRSDALGSAMVDALGDRPVCLLRGHGLTATGSSVESAVINAINVDALARIQLQVLQAGVTPAAVAPADLDDLPDLGPAFNEQHVWRFHLADLEHAGLGIR